MELLKDFALASLVNITFLVPSVIVLVWLDCKGYNPTKFGENYTMYFCFLLLFLRSIDASLSVFLVVYSALFIYSIVRANAYFQVYKSIRNFAKDYKPVVQETTISAINTNVEQWLHMSQEAVNSGEDIFLGGTYLFSCKKHNIKREADPLVAECSLLVTRRKYLT